MCYIDVQECLCCDRTFGMSADKCDYPTGHTFRVNVQRTMVSLKGGIPTIEVDVDTENAFEDIYNSTPFREVLYTTIIIHNKISVCGSKSCSMPAHLTD